MARKPAAQAVSRDEILNAAADVFRRQGYHGAKMSDIAGEVDLTAGSLYHHFPGGKQQILREVMNNGLDMVTREVSAIVEDHTLAPDAKLRGSIRAHVLALTQNTAVAAALVFETRNILMDTDGRNAYLERRDVFEQLFRRVIVAGIESGIFREVDVPLFTKALLGAQNWVGVWYREGGRLDGAAIADTMADVYLRALQIS